MTNAKDPGGSAGSGDLGSLLGDPLAAAQDAADKEKKKKRRRRRHRNQKQESIRDRNPDRNQQQSNSGNSGGGGSQGGSGGGGDRHKGGSGKGDGGKNHKGGKDGGKKNSEWAAEYGWSLAFLKQHKALWKIFNEAVDNSWSPQRFVAEIQDTDWFKNHADVVRQNQYLATTDPQTFQHRVDQMRASLSDQAGALGIEVSDKLLDAWAKRAVVHGWNDNQIANHLASQVDIMKKHGSTMGGSLAATQDRLENLAFSNGVRINKRTMQNWLRQIVRGNSTMEEYQQYITKMAVAAHPNFKAELEGGMTLAEIADPYRQTMAQVLEVDPSQIGLDDKMLRRALSMKDEKGKWHSMTMYDFEDQLRNDPRWMKTDNAKEQFMNTGSSILKMFGLAG